MYSICLPLSCIGYFNFSINFNTITGTHVQKIFFFFLGMRELFIDELFNECFHLQENAKKISTDGLFFFKF